MMPFIMHQSNMQFPFHQWYCSPTTTVWATATPNLQTAFCLYSENSASAYWTSSNCATAPNLILQKKHPDNVYSCTSLDAAQSYRRPIYPTLTKGNDYPLPISDMIEKWQALISMYSLHLITNIYRGIQHRHAHQTQHVPTTPNAGYTWCIRDKHCYSNLSAHG